MQSCGFKSHLPHYLIWCGSLINQGFRAFLFLNCLNTLEHVHIRHFATDCRFVGRYPIFQRFRCKNVTLLCRRNIFVLLVSTISRLDSLVFVYHTTSYPSRFTAPDSSCTLSLACLTLPRLQPEPQQRRTLRHMHLPHAASQRHRHTSIVPSPRVLVKLAGLQRNLNLSVFHLCYFHHSTLFVFQ